MKRFSFILCFICFLSCSPNKEKSKYSNDYTATVIVHSELGAPITIKSNKERIVLFEEKGAKGKDTVQLRVFPWDLVVAGYNWGTILKDTLLVHSQDTIIAKITKEQITTRLRRAGKDISAKWNDAKLLPKNKAYTPISEMYEIRSKIVFPPPPPPPVDAPEIVKQEIKVNSNEFMALKRDFTVKDTLRKYAKKYIQGIDKYYTHRLNQISEEPDSLKRNFNESYILFNKFNDLKTLQRIVRSDEIQLSLKKLCEKQSRINGAFAEKTSRYYFFDNYFFNRKCTILLTTLYDSIIPTEFDYQEKLLKEITLREMLWKKYPRKEIIAYIDKYVAQYGTNTTIEELKTDIEYDLEVTNDLNLIATDGTKITFEELRKQHKGKILYVDFWASWCHPCRMMLPYSKELYKKLHNDDIVFIYLALWDKEKAWKIACEEDDLYENSYRIVNSKTSTFIEKMKIASIPHYMIYGKDGKLYQNDSPRPDTNEIRKILKDLTK